jgi:PPOX class probable F420-dependent enzyme
MADMTLPPTASTRSNNSPWTEPIRAFLDAPRYAVVATLNPDGSPHQAVVWYRLDGEDIVLNSAEGRRWPANLRRDPRISFMVEDGLRYVSARGRVQVEDDQEIAQADIAEMARRYHADRPDHAEELIRDRFSRQRRITFRFRPSRILVDL